MTEVCSLMSCFLEWYTQINKIITVYRFHAILCGVDYRCYQNILIMCNHWWVELKNWQSPLTAVGEFSFDLTLADPPPPLSVMRRQSERMLHSNKSSSVSFRRNVITLRTPPIPGGSGATKDYKRMSRETGKNWEEPCSMVKCHVAIWSNFQLSLRGR